jgi:hypothetical protein
MNLSVRQSPRRSSPPMSRAPSRPFAPTPYPIQATLQRLPVSGAPLEVQQAVARACAKESTIVAAALTANSSNQCMFSAGSCSGTRLMGARPGRKVGDTGWTGRRVGGRGECDWANTEGPWGPNTERDGQFSGRDVGCPNHYAMP